MYRKLLSMTIISMLAVLTLAVAGCGGDDDDDDGGENAASTPCELTHQLICEMACDCGEDSCFYFNGASSSDYSDEEFCYDVGVEYTCDEEDYPADFDFDACMTALESAGCEQYEYAEMVGLALPDECDGL